MNAPLTNYRRSLWYIMLQNLVACAVILAILTLAGCRKKSTIALNVDLYLHPEAATSDDLLLQTAIQKQLSSNDITKNSLIHVRVVDRIAFLNGSVGTQSEKQRANEIAQAVAVTVDQVTIRTKEVQNNIVVEP
jgi:osmotically-inducible protein OsmY